MTMTAPDPAKRTSAWEVIPIGHSGWRICDVALSESDPSRLIAYIDKNETGMLDVLWLRSPCPTRSRYRALDELLADLDAAVEADVVSRSTRPTQIPHFPPHM